MMQYRVKAIFRTFFVSVVVLIVNGCASLNSCVGYCISEQDMDQYLESKAVIKQSVRVENVMSAQVSVDDLDVKIGRADAERLSIFAHTKAKVQMLMAPSMTFGLAIEFSAIPKYSPKTGEIFLQFVRLEQFEDENHLLPPEVFNLLQPAASMIGYALSNQPVYQLDSKTVQAILQESTNPSLVIKNNHLVIEVSN